MRRGIPTPASGWKPDGARSMWTSLSVKSPFSVRLQSAHSLHRIKHDPWGCMADTITIMPGVDLTAPSGEEWNAAEGLLLNE